MFLTIVTTTLNSEAYLRNTLESIKKQYNENIQYILVDAGSTDNTLRIVEDYEFVELYRYPDSTMYEAIDFGFKKAKGEVLSWINSDDVYADNTFKRVFREFRNSEIDILTGNLEYIDKQGNEIYPYNFWLANKLFVDVFNDLMICQPATFFTKELYYRIGGLNLDYKIVADRDFFIRAFREAKVKNTHEILVQFRVHEKNLSIVRRGQAVEENKIINKRLNAGPTSLKNVILFFIGHLISKLFNPKMVWYKIKNGKRSIYL